MSNSLNGVRPVFVKTVSALTSIATLLTLSGAAYLAPLTASAAVPSDYGLTEGNMISATGSNDPDVYIVNAQGYKRLFLNPVIFGFYGQLTGGWALVKSVSAAARDAFPTSLLFRNCETNAQAVYAVEVTGEDTATLHHVVMTGDQAVAQDSQFFNKVFCVNSLEQNWYTMGYDYTSLSQIQPYVRGGVSGQTPTPTPVSVGPVSASLSPDNPASGTVIAGQGVADLAHFRLSNPASNAVAVNSLKFQRLGISGDTTFANVYVFSLNPNARLTDAVTPSSGVISINGGTSTSSVLTIPANSYVDIAVKSDIYGTNTSGQTVGIALTSVNGIAVSGLNGNLFQIAAAPTDLATAQFTAATSQGSPATTSVTPATGTTDPLHDTVVWQDIVSINNKNVYLKSFALRQTNSINMADVSNFRLFIDGTQVAQVQNLDANGYVTFNPASPVTILTGSRTIKVLADITGGTSRKLTMSLRSSADVQMTDSNYGSGVSATLVSGNFPLNGGDLSINSGSITVQKDVTSPSGNIVKGTSDAVLGRWTFTAYGEPTKVSTLIAGVHSGTGTEKGLRNGRIMVYPVGNPAAAQQYGSTTSLQVQPTSTTASVSYTTNLVVNPGTPVTVEVRGDIYDNVATTDVTAAGDTLTADLYTGSSNGQGMVSLTTSNVPTSRINGNQLTIAAGSATISQNASFPSQQIVVPQTNTRIGSFVVAGSTNEAINVNTLTLDVTAGGANGVIGDLSNVYLMWNGVKTSVKSSITSTGNTYSVAQVLAANSTIIVDVYADLATEAAATYISKLEVSGTTVQSAQTVNTLVGGTSTSSAGSTFVGQTMTVGSSVFASAVAASNPAARLIAANQTVDVAKFTFTSTVGNSLISELQFKTLASASQAGISSVILKNASGTVLGTGSLSTSGSSQIVTFGGLTGLTVPANSSDGLTLTAAVTTAGVGVNMASSALNVGLSLNYVKYTDATGVLNTDNTDRAGNAVYLHAAYPIVTAVALPSTLLSTGVQTVSKFTVAASNGSIGLGRFFWTINKTATPTVSSTSWQLLENGIDISSFGQWASSSVGAGYVAGKIQWTASSSAPFNGALERLVSSTTPNTYELRVNITAAGTTGDNYNTVLTRATSVLTPTTAETFAIAHGATLTGPAIVWSDRSALSHSQATADWMNDYLVNSFPISEGLSK